MFIRFFSDVLFRRFGLLFIWFSYLFECFIYCSFVFIQFSIVFVIMIAVCVPFFIIICTCVLHVFRTHLDMIVRRCVYGFFVIIFVRVCSMMFYVLIWFAYAFVWFCVHVVFRACFDYVLFFSKMCFVLCYLNVVRFEFDLRTILRNAFKHRRKSCKTIRKSFLTHANLAESYENIVKQETHKQTHTKMI